MELRRLDEAISSFDKAIAIKSDYAVAHSNRGNALKDLGRFDEAIASYDNAIAVAPSYADAHSNRANTLLALRQFEQALARGIITLTNQAL